MNLIPKAFISSFIIFMTLAACGDSSNPEPDPDDPSFGLRVETLVTLPFASNDGVSFDRQGNLFVSNAGQFVGEGLSGSVVYQVDTSSQASVSLDNLDGPLGSVSDEQGNLYVSNFNTGAIVRRDPNGVVSTFATLPGSGGGLAIDSTGQLVAASYTASALYRVDAVGGVALLSDNALFAGPVGISFDENNLLYVGNFDDGKVLRVTPDGQVSTVVDLGTNAGQNIGYLTYMGGCVYATSLQVHKVFAVSPGGAFSELAGTGVSASVDGPVATAQFAQPNGITGHPAGDRLYVSQYVSPDIRVLYLGDSRCPME